MEMRELNGFINEGDRKAFFIRPEAVESIMESTDLYYQTEAILPSGKSLELRKEFEELIKDFANFIVLTLNLNHGRGKDGNLIKVAINPEHILSIEELSSGNTFINMTSSSYQVKDKIDDIVSALA